MKKLLIIILLGNLSIVNAQNDTIEREWVFKMDTNVAEPIGGHYKFSKYIYKNIHYPEEAKKNCVEGSVYIQFTVTKDGSLTDVIVLKGIGSGCDEEAIRLIKNAPKWKPSYKNGKPVEERRNIPIKFYLPDECQTKIKRD